MKMTMSRMAGALGVATLLAGSAGRAECSYRDQALDELRTIQDFLGERGYAQQQVFTGWLRNGERSRFTVYLGGGSRYAVAGGCDDDCQDLDLELSRGGSVVDEDIARDARPLVMHDPDWRAAGTHTVEVTMANCTTSPCFFAVGVFSR
jgi:hypothetical protein